MKEICLFQVFPVKNRQNIAVEILVAIGFLFMVFDSFIVLSFQVILFAGAKIGNIILLINRIGTCYLQRFH